MYKLIAMDMDGTLLKDDKSISERTKNAIKKAKAKGAKVVLASGRSIDGIYGYLIDLDLISDGDYVLSYNGALIQNTETKEIINFKALSGKDGKILRKVSRDVGVNILGISLKNGLFTPKNTRYTQQVADRNCLKLTVKELDEVDEDDEIGKFMMIDEPEVLNKAIELLPKELYEQYSILRSNVAFLEFVHKDCNKGAGVKALADYLGIDKSEVICVGDEGNDKHMIEFAGLGVAMGNATEEIKSIAQYVTLSNEEDGVAHLIEKFILED